MNEKNEALKMKDAEEKVQMAKNEVTVLPRIVMD
jgi:hypothetical protein